MAKRSPQVSRARQSRAMIKKDIKKIAKIIKK